MPDKKIKSTDVVIPIVEEKAVISKREIPGDKVTVRTIVNSHEELLKDVVMQQNVIVERVALDEEISEIPQIRQVDGTTIIPVVDEILVVEKRYVLREEIHVRKYEVAVEVEETVTLRSTDVNIEKS